MREGGTLVVAAPPAPPPVQRHRDDTIGVQRLKPAAAVGRPEFAEQLRQPFAGMMLEAQNGVAPRCEVRAETEHGFKGERDLAAVDAAAVRVRERADGAGAARTGRQRVAQQTVAAGRTNRAGARCQRALAEVAKTGINEMDQSPAHFTAEGKYRVGKTHERCDPANIVDVAGMVVNSQIAACGLAAVDR